MNLNHDIRDAFSTPLGKPATVSPAGFLIDDEIFTRLEGRIVEAGLIRKRFESARLVCSSPDGKRSKLGSDCRTCDRPGCSARLKLIIEDGGYRYRLELASTSAHNFIQFVDLLTKTGRSPEKVDAVLTVRDRRSWGEVRFSIASGG